MLPPKPLRQRPRPRKQQRQQLWRQPPRPPQLSRKLLQLSLQRRPLQPPPQLHRRFKLLQLNLLHGRRVLDRLDLDRRALPDPDPPPPLLVPGLLLHLRRRRRSSAPHSSPPSSNHAHPSSPSHSQAAPADYGVPDPGVQGRAVHPSVRAALGVHQGCGFEGRGRQGRWARPGPREGRPG